MKSKITKSDFVRKMGKRPAKDVVALAAKRGMKLTERYVYVIRSADKAKRYRTRTSPAERTSDATLRHAIAELGLSRSRAVFAEVEKAFEGR